MRQVRQPGPRAVRDPLRLPALRRLRQPGPGPATRVHPLWGGIPHAGGPRSALPRIALRARLHRCAPWPWPPPLATAPYALPPCRPHCSRWTPLSACRTTPTPSGRFRWSSSSGRRARCCCLAAAALAARHPSRVHRPGALHGASAAPTGSGHPTLARPSPRPAACLQPAYAQRGAKGIEEGTWQPEWQLTRSTKCVHLLRRLLEVGAAVPPGSRKPLSAKAICFTQVRGDSWGCCVYLCICVPAGSAGSAVLLLEPPSCSAGTAVAHPKVCPRLPPPPPPVLGAHVSAGAVSALARRARRGPQAQPVARGEAPGAEPVRGRGWLLRAGAAAGRGAAPASWPALVNTHCSAPPCLTPLAPQIPQPALLWCPADGSGWGCGTGPQARTLLACGVGIPALGARGLARHACCSAALPPGGSYSPAASLRLPAPYLCCCSFASHVFLCEPIMDGAVEEQVGGCGGAAGHGCCLLDPSGFRRGHSKPFIVPAGGQPCAPHGRPPASAC